MFTVTVTTPVTPALAEAESDPTIRAVVITGAGGTFSVGEDINGDDPETAWPFSTIGGRGGSSAAVKPRSTNLIVESSRVTGDVRPLLGRGRVWALFAEGSNDARTKVLDYLGRHGKLLQSFHASGPSAIAASLYLYDFRDPRRG